MKPVNRWGVNQTLGLLLCFCFIASACSAVDDVRAREAEVPVECFAEPTSPTDTCEDDVGCDLGESQREILLNTDERQFLVEFMLLLANSDGQLTAAERKQMSRIADRVAGLRLEDTDGVLRSVVPFHPARVGTGTDSKARHTIYSLLYEVARADRLDDVQVALLGNLASSWNILPFPQQDLVE